MILSFIFIFHLPLTFLILKGSKFGSTVAMETTETANNVESREAASGLDENISAVSALPPSPSPISLHSTGGSDKNITRIDRALYLAAVEGNLEKFKDIQNLESLLTPNKNTVLHIHLTSTTSETAQNVSEKPVSKEFVNQILDKCGDLVLLPNAKGETLLHIAAKYGHSTVAKLLVDRATAFPPDIENGIGADKKFIRATNNEKDTAFHEAVRYGHIEVVKALLEMDPHYSYCANNANETPLYLASERQQQQVVAEILKKVKSPAYVGPNNQTALHAAVINQDIEMVRDLLENEHVRAAVKHADNDGWIPLHYAAEGRRKVLTELLLKEDEKSAYMQDNEGRTALHIAAGYGDSCNVEMIIKYCPDCSEIVDNKGQNALHHAVNGGRPHIVKKIMSNPSLSNLYNEKDVSGNTPIHLLAANSHIKWGPSRLIYDGRVDKLALNMKDQTPLDVVYDNLKDDSESGRAQVALISRLERFGAKQKKRLNISENEELVFSKEAKQTHLLVATGLNILENEELVFSKEAKQTHLLVATLIATVCFAAGITLPGGTIQEGDHKGTPILGQRASFKAFIISDTLAMVLATTAAFIHLFTPLAKSKFKAHRLSELAFLFTLYALAAMIVAFATGTYAVLGASPLGIAIITVALSFFYLANTAGVTWTRWTTSDDT